ncbi:MAG: hypothetical protein IPH86_18410 [bacterium]|nr:hypothetical protein [bacterium]
MSAEATESRSEPGIRLVAGPELTMLEVRKEDAVREFASDHQVEFKLNLKVESPRPECPRRRAVGADHESTGGNACGLSIRHRDRQPARGPRRPASALKQVGGRVAPSLMYPFIREALVSSLLRAQLPAFVPPIVNFANVFDLATLAVPEARQAGT